MQAPVVIVGAGLAGLAAASRLSQAGRPVLLLEAQSSVGGRVQTDQVDGFRLDRGFQVLQTAYPHARQVWHYSRLQLCPMNRGALLWQGQPGRFATLADPLRHPVAALAGLRRPVGLWSDYLALLQLRFQVTSATSNTALMASVTEQPTRRYLEQYGFSPGFVNQFFRPFYSGVFLEDALETSAKKFVFTFRQFALGPVAIPASGIGALAKQLAENLPSKTLRFGAPVAQVAATEVTLTNGERLEASAVVVATDPIAACTLLDTARTVPMRESTTLYYAHTQPPPACVSGPWLLLNATAEGMVRHAHVATAVSRQLAPKDRVLLSVTLTDAALSYPSDALFEPIAQELLQWFGPWAKGLQPLRGYRITRGLPVATADYGELDEALKALQHSANQRKVYLAGDYCSTGSIDGALASGLAVADTLLAKPHA